MTLWGGRGRNHFERGVSCGFSTIMQLRTICIKVNIFVQYSIVQVSQSIEWPNASEDLNSLPRLFWKNK